MTPEPSLTTSEPSNNPQPVAKSREYSEAFDAFWSDYGRKGNKYETAKVWGKLSAIDRRLCHELLPAYQLEAPDPKFRLDAERYVKRRRWENYLGKDGEEIEPPRPPTDPTAGMSWAGKAAQAARADLGAAPGRVLTMDEIASTVEWPDGMGPDTPELTQGAPDDTHNDE